MFNIHQITFNNQPLVSGDLFTHKTIDFLTFFETPGRYVIRGGISNTFENVQSKLINSIEPPLDICKLYNSYTNTNGPTLELKNSPVEIGANTAKVLNFQFIVNVSLKPSQDPATADGLIAIPWCRVLDVEYSSYGFTQFEPWIPVGQTFSKFRNEEIFDENLNNQFDPVDSRMWSGWVATTPSGYTPIAQVAKRVRYDHVSNGLSEYHVINLSESINWSIKPLQELSHVVSINDDLPHLSATVSNSMVNRFNNRTVLVVDVDKSAISTFGSITVSFEFMGSRIRQFSGNTVFSISSTGGTQFLVDLTTVRPLVTMRSY